MCLSIAYIDSDGRKEEVMENVAQIEAQDDGFLLIGLFGEQKFVQGRIKNIDFVNMHTVTFEKK